MRRLLLVTVGCLVIGAGCGPRQEGPRPLRIWHWMTDREDAFNELARRYREDTGTAVRFELYVPSDLYVQKVRAAAQTDGLPEIFGVLGELRDLASFIHAGHVGALDEPLGRGPGSWRETLFPKALAVNAFERDNPYGVDPGIYGIPIDVMNIQVFYNTQLLAQLGLDPESPPRTWAEFLKVGELAAGQNLIGMVSGWAELWMIDCFATNYAIHTMGMEKVERTYQGAVAYTDPDWIRVFALFEQLRDSGLLAEGVVTMVNKRAEQLFANGRAVFAFNGSWGINVYQGMNPDLEFGIMMPPAVTDRPVVTWGGAGSSFFVNASAERRAEALAFLEWLTAEPQQRYLLETTHNIPANRAAAAGITGPLAAFASAMDATVHPRLFAAQEHSTVIETFDKGIQRILIGEATASDVARDVQAVKDREMSRQAPRRDAAAASVTD